MQKAFFFTFLLMRISSLMNAQTIENNSFNDTTVYNMADKMPEFPGGLATLQTYLAQNIDYPPEAIKNNVTGTVVIKFVIEKDGSISNPVILKDIGYGCGEHIISILKKMPAWSAGVLKEQVIRVSMVMPVSFRLPKVETTKK